jgi:hypothetical protein
MGTKGLLPEAEPVAVCTIGNYESRVPTLPRADFIKVKGDTCEALVESIKVLGKGSPGKERCNCNVIDATEIRDGLSSRAALIEWVDIGSKTGGKIVMKSARKKW